MTKEVDAYIAAAPKKAQPHLRQLRDLIKEAAPEAEERISYKMPAYRYRGNLVYFSAFRNHVGLYPGGYMDKYPELAKYMAGKGTLRFPLDEPLPAALIKKFIKARVKENEARPTLSSTSSPPSTSSSSPSRRRSASSRSGAT